MSLAVVHGVHGGKGILVRENLIQPHGSEILTNPLQGIAESLGDPARCSRGGEEFRAVWLWPQSQERLDTRDSAGPRSGIGHEGQIAQAESLPEAFVVSEQEGLIPADRATEG